jgi:Phage integrase family
MREDAAGEVALELAHHEPGKTRAASVTILHLGEEGLPVGAHGRAQGIDGKRFESRTKFQQSLARACKRAGIPHTTPNDLRRTYSTWLRACGVPNELSAPTMGHKDTRMLDRVYARLPPEMLRARLLLALGVKDATEAGARCSAGAVNTSGQGGQIGRSGQDPENVTPGKLAPQSPRI